MGRYKKPDEERHVGITLFLPPWMKKALNVRKSQFRCTRSGLIQRAINEFIERHEPKYKSKYEANRI